MNNNKTHAATLALLTRSQMKYMDGESTAIRSRCGVAIRRATMIRAVMNGLAEAKISFAACRSEAELSDRVRDLVRIAAASAPATTEVSTV